MNENEYDDNINNTNRVKQLLITEIAASVILKTRKDLEATKMELAKVERNQKAFELSECRCLGGRFVITENKMNGAVR